jgi:hypothetical protein
MEPEIIIFMFGVLSPLFIFIFGRQLLDNKTSWLILVKVSAVIAIVGIILTAFNLGKQSMFISLVVPLYSISIYRPLYLYIVNKTNRQPIDTAMDWRSGLFYDRLFNIVYIVLSTVVPMVGLLVLISLLNKNGY